MKNIFFITLLIILGISCKKKPIETPKINTEYSNGILCLNEGLFQQNNASLSFYQKNNSAVDNSIFKKVNGRGLGDTANDMISYSYNGEQYLAIVVNVSSQIEILNLNTLETVKQIGVFNENNESRSPRSIAVYNDHLYIVNFDGTVLIVSLANYNTIKILEVGNNPDHNLLVDDALWVVNTGGLNYPNYDSTISVIDLNSNTIVSTINVGINPGKMVADDQGNVYVISRGNYSNLTPKLIRINKTSKLKEATYHIPITQMAYLQNNIYYYDEDQKAIKLFNTDNLTFETGHFIDCGNFETFYQIHIDPYNQDIYLNDANGYVNMSSIRKYDKEGNYKNEFNTGLITSKLLFTP
ncbi:hypothetical protein DNU06_00765 [Putridiphycobacter roseus]|uniref:YncE family protein n=1 Tax=Putridiphycobacter roseus TaxID=2219161 RepID=A0A2W1N5J7_9FLAO|nr:DUF5074 domain-containing protein [Putridiphycobacter roseus]PZE18401.1 hypothetical protein DNU06_00765 [Putridiphycobacter roseus]